MSNETQEAGDVDGGATSMLTAAFASFNNMVPDWATMPATAIFMFLDDHIYSAREWAFKAHSPKDALEWKERVERYQKALPKVKEQIGIDEAPEVSDELATRLMLVVGAALGLLAQTLDLVDNETGEINFNDVWTDEFLQSAQYTQMSSWGDQSFTWITLKLRELADRLCPIVMQYECRECSPHEVVNHTMPILALTSAVLFILAIEHLDDDAKEQLVQALTDGMEMPAPQEPS